MPAPSPDPAPSPEPAPSPSAASTVAPAEVVARLRAAGCVFAEEEAALLLADGRELEPLLARRIAGEPLEHVLGWVGFAGLRLAVGAGCFVPRRRSELLVEEARRRMPAGATAIELCAGVGAISAALLDGDPGLRLHAVEIDPIAAGYARRNVEPRGGVVLVGDLDAPLPASLRGGADLLVANAPYVPSGELGLLPVEAREHEPRATLDGGPDGLDLARRIAARAPRWLAPGGVLLVETSERQAPALAAIMRDAGLAPEIVRDDDRDATVVVGTTHGAR